MSEKYKANDVERYILDLSNCTLPRHLDQAEKIWPVCKSKNIKKDFEVIEEELTERQRQAVEQTIPRYIWGQEFVGFNASEIPPGALLARVTS